MVTFACPNGFDVNLSWYRSLNPFFYFPLVKAKNNKTPGSFHALKRYTNVIVQNMRYVYYGRLTLYNMKVDHFMYTLSFQFNTNYLSKYISNLF